MFNKAIQQLLAAISEFHIQSSVVIQRGNQEFAYLAQINEIRKLLGDVEISLPNLTHEAHDETHYKDPDDDAGFTADDFLSDDN